MRGIPVIAGLALAFATPAAAEEPASEQDAVIAGANAFFAAIASEDKTALAGVMIPEAVIFVHNRMDPGNPRVDVVPVAEHLAGWAKSTGRFDEMMFYETILIDGDMAQVWGPYSFRVNDKLTHCGINSLSMVRMEDGSWKVGNTSFTMVPPAECRSIGANWVFEE